MKKLFIFLTMLVLGIVSSWADDITVTLVGGTSEPLGTLMTSLSEKKLTSKDASGLAGVVVSNVATAGSGTWLETRQLTIKPSVGKTAEKITITAPQGYIITGYSIKCCNFSSSSVYTIDKSETYSTSTATTLTTYSNYTKISATFPSLPLTTSTTNTASFWIYANAETASVNWLMINEFKVTLKQVITPPTSLTDGWYQLKWVNTAEASDYEDQDVEGKYVFNYATDVTVNSNNYALYLGESTPSTLSEHATTFVYVENYVIQGSSGISGNLQSANGRYISRSGASSLTAPSDKNYIIFYSSSSYPVNSVITSATSGNDRISLVPQGNNATPYIGQTNAADKYPMVQFCPVNLSEYNIQAWTVSILDPAGTHDVENTQVTYTGSNLYGLNKVYHNGTFFIASGTTPSATDFTAPVRDGVTPAISVDATNHIITVRYSVNVTYKMMFNGSEIKSVVVGENIGATASTPSAWTTPAFSSFTCPSTTITAETTEIEVTLTWDGPFDISPDFENANWYYLKMHGQYLIYSGSSTTPNSLDDLASAESAASKAFWAFVGDPFNGFQLINKAAGSDKNLAVKWWNPNMDTQETKWLLQSWNSDFALRTSSYFYLNNADGQLKLWVSSTSTEAMNFDCAIESVSYKGLALDFIDEYTKDKIGGYFEPTQSAVDALKSIYENASSVESSDYNNLKSIIIAQLAVLGDGFLYPSTGYYRIKNNGTGNYLAYGTPTANGKTPSAGLIATSNNTDAASIIKLTGSSGTYKLSVQGLNIQSQTTNNVAFPGSDAEGVDFVFNVSTPGVVSITNEASATDSNHDGSLHEGTEGWTVHGVVNFSASNPNSKWVVEDATGFDVAMNGPVGDNYYATLCVPFDVTISDATAYTLAKSESGNYLVPTEVTGNKVPAGTPVLLKGKNETATATINTASAFNSGSPLTCALTGTYVAKPIDGGNDYVLGKKDGKVGFYHWSSNNLAANRAYLAAESVAAGARGFALMFEDDATGIVSTPGETEEGTVIYNLSGQRLNKMQKGINIVNGKKVLF